MVQRFSQNGWPAYPTASKFTRFTAAGQGWWAANEDVAVCFTEFIERFDKEVEEITQQTLDDWSYANRLVRGSSTVVSNHGSATAIDINALKHPRGVHNTFSPDKAKAVRKIKNAITDDAGVPVLRLGMDYESTVDDMHVEVNARAHRMKQAADKIRKKNKELDVDDRTLQRNVKAALVDWSDDPTIENTPLKPGDPAAPPWTLKKWAAAQDKKADQSKKDVAEVKAQAASNGGHLSNLTGEVAVLKDLVAELLTRIPPVAK